MLKKLISLLNKAALVINSITLVLFLIWAFAGIWHFVSTDAIYYWQIHLSLITLMVFNLLLLFTVVAVYRRNLNLVDFFRESEYTTEYTAEDLIFAEGDNEKVMYLLLKGQVEIIKDKQVMETIESGGIFGEMSIIEDLPRSASARCVGTCKLIPINEKRFYALLRETPFFATEVMRVMSHRLRSKLH